MGRVTWAAPAAVTKCHRPGVLNKQTFVFLQFRRPEARHPFGNPACGERPLPGSQADALADGEPTRLSPPLLRGQEPRGIRAPRGPRAAPSAGNPGLQCGRHG